MVGANLLPRSCTCKANRNKEWENADECRVRMRTLHIKCVCLILGHPNRHRAIPQERQAQLHPDFWVHDIAGCPEQNDVQRWQGDPRSPWMTENSLGGLPCVRLGMNQGILHHITMYYHIFGGGCWHLLACSPENGSHFPVCWV